MAQSDITLYFLNGSRAIRIAWLLEELGLSYKLVVSSRGPNAQAPSDFKAKIPTKLGNSPTIQDGDLIIQESGAIVEYLCETYDTKARLIPRDLPEKVKVKEWIGASEGTFLLHALTILYTRMGMPKEAAQYVQEFEAKCSSNVCSALEWLEAELENGPSDCQFLVGRNLTAADIMMGFCVEVIFRMKLGTDENKWPQASKWLANIMSREAYKKAVQKTQYML